MSFSKKTMAIAVAAGMAIGGVPAVVPSVAYAQANTSEKANYDSFIAKAEKRLGKTNLEKTNGILYAKSRLKGDWLNLNDGGKIQVIYGAITTYDAFKNASQFDVQPGRIVLVQNGQSLEKDGSVKTRDGVWKKVKPSSEEGVDHPYVFKFEQSDKTKELDYPDLIVNTLTYLVDNGGSEYEAKVHVPFQNTDNELYGPNVQQGINPKASMQALPRYADGKSETIKFDLSQIVPEGWDAQFVSRHESGQSINKVPSGEWSYDSKSGIASFKLNGGLKYPQSPAMLIQVGPKGSSPAQMHTLGTSLFDSAAFYAGARPKNRDIPTLEMKWNDDRTRATLTISEDEVEKRSVESLTEYYGKEFAEKFTLPELSIGLKLEECMTALNDGSIDIENVGSIYCDIDGEKSSEGEWSLKHDEGAKTYEISFTPSPEFKGTAKSPLMFGIDGGSYGFTPVVNTTSRREIYHGFPDSLKDFVDIQRIPLFNTSITAVEEQPTCDACAEIKALKPRVEALEKAVADSATKDDIKKIHEEIDRLIKEGNASEEQFKTIETRVKNLEERLNLVHDTANSAQDLANEAIRQIGVERARIDELVKNVDSVKTDVKKAQETADKAVEQLNETKTKLSHLQKQLDRERARIDKNESEIKRLEDEIAATNLELTKQTDRVDHLYKVVADQETRLNNLQKSLDEANARIDQLKTDFDDLVERVTKNETDLFWLAAVVAQHEKELQDARDAIAAANELIAQLRIDVDEAREMAESAQMTADQAIKEVAEVRERIDALTKRVEDNEAALAEARKIADQALSNSETNAQEIATAKERVTALESDLARLKHELAYALLVLHKHEQAIDALGDKVTEVEENLKAEIAVERERADALAKRIEAQQVEIDLIAQRVKDHEARIKKLESQVDVHELMRCTVEKSSATVLPLAALAIPLALLSTVSLPEGPANQIAQANTQLQKQMGMYNEQLASAISGLNQGGNPLAGLGAVVATLVAVGIGYNAYSECAANQNTTPIIGGSSSNGSSMRIDDLESVPAKVERGVGLFQRIADRVQKTMSDLGI